MMCELQTYMPSLSKVTQHIPLGLAVENFYAN